MPEDMKPEVILVHGLWYGRASTAVLENRLVRAGFRVSTFTYSSIFRKPKDAVLRLTQWLDERQGRLTHLVGHSLGGLIILQALARQPRPFRGRVVMLGTPLNGSSVARRMARLPLLRRLLGRSSGILQRGVDPSESNAEVCMIAGTAGHGLGRVTGAIDGPSDGTVLLSETRHPKLTAHVEVHTGHTGLLFSAQVANLVIGFLKHGRSTPG